MKILAVDTCAVSASAALCEDGDLLGEFYCNIKQTHSQTLLPMTEDLLRQCGVSMPEIGLFAVSAGPGSFTGVRIGIAAVKGFATPRGVPCAGVSSLLAAAMNVTPGFDGIICAAMDARRNQVYNALFRYEGSRLVRLCDDRAIALSDLKSELFGQTHVVLVGDGAKLCYNTFVKDIRVLLPPPGLVFPHAAGVAAAGRTLYEAGGAVSPEALLPVYLRLPQAERELRAREGKPAPSAF